MIFGSFSDFSSTGSKSLFSLSPILCLDWKIFNLRNFSLSFCSFTKNKNCIELLFSNILDLQKKNRNFIKEKTQREKNFCRLGNLSRAENLSVVKIRSVKPQRIQNGIATSFTKLGQNPSPGCLSSHRKFIFYPIYPILGKFKITLEPKMILIRMPLLNLL